MTKGGKCNLSNPKGNHIYIEKSCSTNRQTKKRAKKGGRARGQCKNMSKNQAWPFNLICNRERERKRFKHIR